jgi:hypothetical protein
MTVTSTPRVGNAAKLHVVLVPLDLGVGGVALLPTTSAAHDAFARAYPIANASVTVTARAPFAVSGVSSIATTANMASLLTQLEALRQQEDPTAIYYGMFPTGADISNYSGLGYIGTPGAESASPASAVGYDAAWQFSSVDPFNLGLQAWTQTMLHEVGHIHSLMHAPCGNPASPDPNYPYAGGILNPNFAMYDSLYASDTAVGLIASTTPSGAGGGSMTDVMGYCSGEFFSDYSYSKVQAFAEARTIAFASPDTVTTAASGLARTGAFQRQETTSAARASHAGYIVISGLLDSSGVTLQPAQATSQDSVGTVPAQSPYALRVTSTAGQVFVYPLQVNEIADAAETTYSFALAVPNPGAVAHVEVLHDGVVVTNSPATQAAIAEEVHRASTTGPARTRGASAAWSEEGGVLRLTWNAAVEPFASVIQVSAAGVRSVVAMRLRGGSAVLPTVALPAGGTLELGFSSTTTARLVTAAR